MKGKESFPGNGKQSVRPGHEDLLGLRKQLKGKEMELEILKKAVSIISKNDYWYIGLSQITKRDGRLEWCVSVGSFNLWVFYFWAFGCGKREQGKQKAKEKINATYFGSHQRYGSPKIAIELTKSVIPFHKQQ